MTRDIGRRRAAAAVLLIALTWPSAAWAKGRTSRLVMTCMGAERPVEVTSAEALSFENGPWGGGFIDTTKGPVAAAPTRRVCQLDFFVRYSEHEERLAYVIYYYPGKGGEQGYVHLPGRGEPWNSLNVGTIVRRGMDGSWRVASRRWEQSLALASLRLAQATVPRTTRSRP